MTAPLFLQDLVIILAIAVGTVALLQRIGVPTIAGFLLAGILMGPRGLGLVHSVHEVEQLAEVGVVLLLFGIGVELSFDRLRRLWRPILVGGTVQVVLAAGATFAAARGFGLETRPSVFLGFLVAVSSTAIVLRGLEGRGEVDAPHGRLTLGILVFQDLCVVPMMLAIPYLAGTGGRLSEALGAFGRALFLLLLVLLAARLLVPRMLHLLARTRQRELFVLGAALACLGTAWGAALAGVSVALGAFLGGLVVSDSEYRHQALSDLIPFREVLTSVFFVSVGMLFDPGVLFARLGPILGITLAILLGKFLVGAFTGAVLRLPLRVCVLAGAALSQVGEFSFVLSRAASGTNLLPSPLASDLLAASILTMLVTPLALNFGPQIAAGVGRIGTLVRLLKVTPAAEVPASRSERKGHVIIAGYGIAGQELARALREGGVPYLIVDLNAEQVRAAMGRGEPAYFGDVTSPEVLKSLGIERASELVVAINDPRASGRAVAAARVAAPGIRVIVRAQYLRDAPHLRETGADEVVPAEVEAAVQLAKRVLRRHGLAQDTVRAQVLRIRARQDEEGGGGPPPEPS